MSEISKLYENARVEKKCLLPNLCEHKGICKYGEKCVHFVYPPFTGEKQIELIKLIAKSKGYPDYEFFGNLFNDYIQLLEFDEALAGLVNSLWKLLPEEEKQQVKGILE